MNIALAEQPHDSLGVDEIFKKAINCHQSEQFAQAEEFYLSALQINPKHSDANYNLGLMAMQLGKSEMGLPYLQTAWESDLTIGQYWLTLTECLFEMGHTKEALMIIEDAILRGIDLPQSLPLLMRVKKQQEKEVKLSSASELVDVGQNVVNFNKSMQSVDQSGLDSHQSLSNYLINCPTDKRTDHKSSKTKSGTLKNSIVKLASISMKKIPQKERKKLKSLYDNGSFDEAEALAIKLTSRYPKDAFGWKILGVLLGQFERREEALLVLQEATSLSIGDAEGHYNLGIVYRSLERLNDAEKSFRCAIKLAPKYAAAFNNLGLILFEKEHTQEAKSCFEEALLISPNYAEAHRNMATVLHVLGYIYESVTHLKRARQIDPDLTNLNSTLLFYMSEMVGVSSEELFAEHCRFGDYVEGPLRASWLQHDNLRDPKKILKIGFVSGDLYNHAVASFIEPVLIHLSDYPQLSLYAYSATETEDKASNRLREYFNQWHSIVGLSDSNLADKIRADGIDVLIDLSGHTAKNRLLTFARKPAPVQVSWIGYPGTTGLQAMDYYLADPFFLPPGQFDDQFTEKIIHLPASAAFLPFGLMPMFNILPAMSNGYITFGSFNRRTKINCSVVSLWSELLRALPNSRMLLGAMSQDGESNSLITLFSLEGIASERLSFYSRTTMEEYLDLHHQVDICLDTFPYNGGTTSCHALSMGVPTLTLTGSTPPGRQGAGILGQVGLEAFVAKDKADFVEKGLSWADNLVELSILRLELRERFKKSAMGQPKIVAAGLERALRVMWRGWCAGQSAESFEVSRQDVDVAVQGEKLKLAESKQQTLPIYVTQPLLPPLEDFIPYLQQIWDSKQLTNGGSFHRQLEQELCEYLGVKHISLFSNGTLALMTAMQTLRITGEVITTPYSFVATAHSLLWNGIKPVFVDIDPITFNLDPSKIEAAITPQTTAIMPVHCYGHPCDVKGIQKIADNYGLKVIYDAAHAFGVQCPDGSILNHGDLSVLSFHATKVFNTFEGGAIVCHDAKTKQRIDQLKNFGFVDEVTVVAAGINGKMSEVNAAFGLLQLKSIDQALQSRKTIDACYREVLARVKGIHCLSESGEEVANYAYFPILVESDYPLSRDELYQKLRDNSIYARRYFYPLISDFPMYRGMPSSVHTNLPVAKRVAEQVICLPIYPDLRKEQIDLIIRIIGN